MNLKSQLFLIIRTGGNIYYIVNVIEKDKYSLLRYKSEKYV